MSGGGIWNRAPEGEQPSPAPAPGGAEPAQAPGRWLLFDWGGTLMRVFPEYSGPMAAWPRVEALPGAVETLAALRGRWSLALATNAADSGEEEIRQALRRAGLDGYLERIYGYRKTGYMKPAPGFFSYILQDLGISPQQAVMVGDDYEVDVRGAVRSGLRAVWLNVRSSPEEASIMVRTISSLPELPGALADFEA